MMIRIVIPLVLIVSTGAYARGSRGTEQPASRALFAVLPQQVGDFHGRDARPYSDDVVAQLGADDYVNRVYLTPSAPPVSLYAGYYSSQRQGDSIHSPRNCLPGAGWQPIFSERATLPGAGGPFEINRVEIAKGRERQAVFYWYQGRGRVVANEFANKGWLMLDAARLQRTDGGLVRVITPLTSSRDEAFARLTAFSTALLPTLWRHLP